ncbi:MAG TPA: SDR family NAD(P)-dependent oxidoreductase, partial [Limnochordales bacterium]
MDLELAGRVALVTGASAGIGRSVARVLAAEGVQLALTARRQALLEELASQLASQGLPRPLVVAADLTAPGEPERLAREVLGRFGRVDILVNSAGGSRPLPVDAPEAAWEEAMLLNFTALRRLTGAVLPAMQGQRWGRIINITGSSEPKG